MLSLLIIWIIHFMVAFPIMSASVTRDGKRPNSETVWDHVFFLLFTGPFYWIVRKFIRP